MIKAWACGASDSGSALALGAFALIVILAALGETAAYWEKATEESPLIRSRPNAATVAEDLKRGLIGWWQAEGNALDSTHNGSGTIRGTVEFADGPSGKAFLFGGGYVEIPDSPKLRFTGPFSVSLWMKVPGYENYLAAIITKGDHSWRLQRDFDGHSVLFSVSGVHHSSFNGHPPVDLPATTAVDDGKWHHVAAVYDGAAEAIYIDGMLDVSAPCSGFPSVDNAPVFIGENSGESKRALIGQISDVRIYNRALSSAEINLLATATHAGASIIGASAGRPQ